MRETIIDETIKQKVFQQAIDIFAIPEIEKRKKMNSLPSNFIIDKVQIIFSLKSGRNYVRLNKEVKAIIRCKVNRGITKGEPIYEKDVDDIESIELAKGDSDYAHITILLFRGNWVISFDFKYNQKMARDHIEASREFYESAKDNLEKGRLRSFFENAFASAELCAKSILLSIPDKKILTNKSHDNTKTYFKNWASLGNVKVEYSTILSKLNSLRSSARYLVSDNYKKEDPKKILLIIKNMIEFSDKSNKVKL